MLELISAILIACVTMIALIWLSLRADRRLKHLERLPMQWSLSGNPTWSAPRRIALSFTPALAALVLIAAVISVALLEPHPGQDGLEIPVVLFLAASLLATHWFHLWMIGRQTDGKPDGGA
jgi:predicted membrane-bound mannosyltransferase